MRSHRADFSKRVRRCIFETFKVTPINLKASVSKIVEWKRSSEVATAYQSLWTSENGQNLSTINKILTKAFPKETSNDLFTPCHIAYTLAVSTILLDPKEKNMRLSDEMLKKRIRLFMVCTLLPILCCAIPFLLVFFSLGLKATSCQHPMTFLAYRNNLNFTRQMTFWTKIPTMMRMISKRVTIFFLNFFWTTKVVTQVNVIRKLQESFTQKFCSYLLICQ
jgi:hypothetical protein